MSEYMGSDALVSLQKAIFARAEEFQDNPLLSNGGRIMNILDPDAYGWPNVRKAAERDGIVGLTMVDRAPTLAALTDMFGAGADLPYWEAFTGAANAVLPACAEVIEAFSLPERWRLENVTAPDDATIHAAQLLNTETGVAPTPAYYLRGSHVPSLLTCVYDETGAMAACASATMRYHPEGPMAGWLFAGGVSVSDAHRRRGLGSYVNAVLLTESHRAFGWVAALEQAKADNAASVGMITRCGLRQDGDKITVIVNLNGGYITR